MNAVLRITGVAVLGALLAAAILVPLYDRWFPVDDREAWDPWSWQGGVA